MKSFCKSHFPHKSVNLSFIITNIKNKLIDVDDGDCFNIPSYVSDLFFFSSLLLSKLESSDTHVYEPQIRAQFGLLQDALLRSVFEFTGVPRP